MRTNIVIFALVAIGCGDTQSSSGVVPVLDGNVEGGAPDSGHVIDESPAQDAGNPPDADNEVDEQDPDHPPSDAAVEEDAGHQPIEDAGEELPEDASVGMCTGEPSEPVTFGTAEEPFELALDDTPLMGTIDWRGRAFARINGVTPGQRYTITANADAPVMISVLTEDTTFTDAACLEGADLGGLGTYCFATATRESLDIAVDARNVAATFELTIRPAYAAQGSPEAPVQIAESALPYNLELSSEGVSYYEVTGLTEGVPHVVTVHASAGPMYLRVYGSESAGDGAPSLGLSDQAHAVGTPEGTSLRFSVQALGAGSAAVLDVHPATREAEGTAGAPVQIAASALPFEGEVGWSYSTSPISNPDNRISQSFYAITGLAPGAYVVSLGDVVEPAHLHLFGDNSAFTGVTEPIIAFPGFTARRAVRITGSVLYAKVVNRGGGGTPFTLDLEPSAVGSEGTHDAPIDIDLGELPYRGEIEIGVDSYYMINGLTPGQIYLARVTDETGSSTGVTLFPDPPFDAPACEIQTQNDGSALPCNVTPSGSSIRVQARVMGSGSAVALGSVFALSLEPIVATSEGTPEAPIVIDCPLGSYTGRVGMNGYGYYEITGLEAGVAYLVEAQAAEDALVLQVFSGAAAQPFQDSDRCDNYESLVDYPARCVETSASGSLFVQLIGYAQGAPLVISVQPAVSGSEGTQSAPIALELSELPYAGQVSAAAPSFYELSSVEPDTAYIARVATVQEGLDVVVYDGEGFIDAQGVALGQVYAGQLFERVFLATETTATLRAALPLGADGITDIAIDMFAAPYQAEGVDAPLALTLADLPRTSSADGTRYSHYTITGLTPGESYIATIASASDNRVIMDVFDDGNLDFDRVCSNDAETGTRDCTFTPSSEAVRLEVHLVDALSASFELDVQLSE